MKQNGWDGKEETADKYFDDIMRKLDPDFEKNNPESQEQEQPQDNSEPLREERYYYGEIVNIEDSIIVINERRLRINYRDEIDSLRRIMNQYNNKVFIFEDTNYCEGEADEELGELASFRMTINKISLDDKIMYCKNKFEELFFNESCSKLDLASFAFFS